MNSKREKTESFSVPRQFRRDKVIFIHIPKCAGSSFLNSYIGYQLGHMRASYYFEKAPDLFFSSFSFSFVRNPIARFLSAYNYINRTTLWSEYMPEARRKLSGYGSSVDEVAVGLSADSELLSLPWFEPQHSYLMVQDQIAVNKVFKTEEFDKAIETLKRETGIYLQNSFEINRSPNLSKDYKQHFSQKAIDTLERVYERDFTLFGYF